MALAAIIFRFIMLDMAQDTIKLSSIVWGLMRILRLHIFCFLRKLLRIVAGDTLLDTRRFNFFVLTMTGFAFHTFFDVPVGPKRRPECSTGNSKRCRYATKSSEEFHGKSPASLFPSFRGSCLLAGNSTVYQAVSSTARAQTNGSVNTTGCLTGCE